VLDINQEVQTGQSRDKLKFWQPENKQELILWAIDQLAIVAVALGEVVTPERLKIYAQDLSADLTREQLTGAFNQSRRECKWFPKIVELREFAGAGKQQQREDVEAEAAFQSVVHSLEREGIDHGIKHLPARTQHAVRQCGGLWQFNNRLQVRYGDDENPSEVDNRSPIFLQRDFVQAYKNYSVHEAMIPQLTEKGILALPQPVRAFLGTGQSQRKPEVLKPVQQAPVFKPKAMPKVPEPLTPAQLAERKAILQQQREYVLAKFGKDGSQGAQRA
jgi:hypothetical protein